jgi:hypothetical protein
VRGSDVIESSFPFFSIFFSLCLNSKVRNEATSYQPPAEP